MCLQTKAGVVRLPGLRGAQCATWLPQVRVYMCDETKTKLRQNCVRYFSVVFYRIYSHYNV